MKTGRRKRWMAWLLALVMLLCQPNVFASAEEVSAQTQAVQIVLTMGADLSQEQRDYILQYFGISAGQVQELTITNADERSQLSGLVSDEVIGTRTVSCALVRPTNSGGIQVKTANTNYVTSNMIAMNLSSSGVYNCEVLIAAPFEVSGTGALTGVMMAYEAASGETLDPEKKQLANEEMVITGEIAETVGQDQATLVVNDIKIHIIRDQITDQQEINTVVDEVIATTEQAAYDAAAQQGQAAPATLGEVHRETLYDYGYKVSQMGYRYKDMQSTLERITRNVTENTGINDPITDTFTTTDEDSALDPNSILLNTNDEVMGEEANINATNSIALGDHPAEPIEVYTGDVMLTEAGGVKARSFIRDTDLVAYQDVNGSYALMDLNGNVLTEAVYTEEFTGYEGHVVTRLDDGSGACGLLASDGVVEIPSQYDDVEVFGELWGAGIKGIAGTEADYDFYSNGQYYQIDTMDVYYLGGEEPSYVGSLTRDQIKYVWGSDAYLLVEDRNETITAYDSSFTPMQGDYTLYDEDSVLEQQLSDATGYSVYSFYGNYARFYDYNTSKEGVMDRYGNVIIPAEFDDIEFWNDYLMAGGYFGVDMGGQFAYVTAGGNVTASYAYPANEVWNYGMSAVYKPEDGSVILMSGDGVETNFGATYDYFTDLSGSKGMLWVGSKDGGYDLIDWHGNVLLSGSDNYSMSANGNYIIAQNGYTSSTLYLVNDASPVALAESAGGAVELEAEIKEGASLEAYTGDPQVELVGEVLATDFLPGTHLLITTEDGTNYGLMALDGTQLTDLAYDYFSYEEGWIVAEQYGEGGGYGLLSQGGAVVIPCTYQKLDVLNENWAVGYKLTADGNAAQYDFKDFDDNYYFIDEATVYHMGETELASVTLTRDQIADIAAEEDYLNVQDRSTGAITTYDSTFTAVASANNIYSFTGLSSKSALAEKLQDTTGYYVSDEEFADGYSEVYDSVAKQYGVIDMNGTVIVPPEFDGISSYYGEDTHIWAKGYFAVERDGLAGYVTKDGQVTCELKYEEDKFYNHGMTGEYENEDGTYTLVAADGVETPGFASTFYSYGDGLFLRARNDDYSYKLIDWHGNVLFENFAHVDVSYDSKFILVIEDYSNVPKLYAVDGAQIETPGEAMPLDQPTGETEQETQVQGTAPVTEAAEPETQALPAQTEASQVPAEQTEAPAAAQTQAQTEAPVVAETQAQTEAAPAAPTESQAETAAPQAGQTGSDQAAAQPADSDASSGASQSGAGALLSSAVQLLELDIEANRDSVVTLLSQAKTMLDAENPDAAALINSAVTLLQAGATDAAAVTTLISTAQGML